MVLPSGTRLGAYEILAPLGAGGMGEVYRARDPNLRRDVAIKVVPESLSEHAEALVRFEREALAVAALSHPNILTIFGFGREGKTAFAVTELLDGKTLREVLGAGPIPVDQAVRHALQAASGIAAAHEKGIVHRDLKPENLFLTADGRIKVLDFGLARRIEPDGSGPLAPDAGNQTGSGVVLGTVGYMAPEQARGKPCDARTDVFALGCVLYEMLSGRRAFHGETAADTISAILHEEPPPLAGPTGAPALQEIVSRCLRKRPEERFATARDLASALEQVLGPGRPISSVPTTAPTLAVASGRSGTRTRNRRRALVASGALLLVALAGAVLLWRAGGGAAGGPKRLAVLPFENLSGDPGQEYLSDGLTHELIAQLGRLHPASLSVIARTSVMRYKKAETPVDRIGRELNVEYLLEGSARREGSRIRITAELIQVKDQAQLWSDSFERDLSGILSLQNDVARKVAEALALKLLPAERSRIATARTVDPEAYEAYLKGLQSWYQLTPAAIDTAEGYYRAALAKDPDYALAHAGIALVWGARVQIGIASPAEVGPKARAAARKAIELDDTVAETHYALACIRTWMDWDWVGAEPEFRRAIELNPSFPDARAYYSHLLLYLGRPAEALAEGRRAVELDPLNPLLRVLYGVDLLYARRFDDAISEARTAIRISPDNPARAVLWFAYRSKGTLVEALAAARMSFRYYGDPRIDAAFERGEKEGGYRGAMARAAEAVATLYRESYANPTDVAMLLVESGNLAGAIEWLEKAYAAHDPNMPYIGTPLYDPLRPDPRFQALVRKMNLPIR